MNLFWFFNSSKKEDLYSMVTFTFKDEASAKNFHEQISDKQTKKDAENYYWNDSFGGKDKQKIDIKLEGNSVHIRYGNGGQNNE